MVNDEPSRKTCFGPVNSGSPGTAFHREGRFRAQAEDRYTSMKASSNLKFPTFPLQYLVKCLRRESSLFPLMLPPHARHMDRFPVVLMCLLHSHLPRKPVSHTLQHHFPRMWLNTGKA